MFASRRRIIRVHAGQGRVTKRSPLRNAQWYLRKTRILASPCPFRLTLLAFDIHMLRVCARTAPAFALFVPAVVFRKIKNKKKKNATKSVLDSDVQPPDLPLGPPSAPQVNRQRPPAPLPLIAARELGSWFQYPLMCEALRG